MLDKRRIPSRTFHSALSPRRQLEKSFNLDGIDGRGCWQLEKEIQDLGRHNISIQKMKRKNVSRGYHVVASIQLENKLRPTLTANLIGVLLEWRQLNRPATLHPIPLPDVAVPCHIHLLSLQCSRSDAIVDVPKHMKRHCTNHNAKIIIA